MIKSLKSHHLISIFSLLIFLFMISDVHAQNKLLWEETKFNINLNGGIGLGFQNDPIGGIEGGLDINLDLIFLNLKFLNLGITTGVLSLSSTLAGTENRITGAIPVNLMAVKYFRPKWWEFFPYAHFSPGVYLKTDLIFPRESSLETSYTIVITETAEPNELKIGPGFSTGGGMLFTLSDKLFLNCDLRFHLFRVDEELKYVLSNNMGLSLYF